MNIWAIPLIGLDGVVHRYPCRECSEPARIRYAFLGLTFDLCMVCLLLMEQKTSVILTQLLQEKPH